MAVADEIKNWQGKPKELIVFISDKIVKEDRDFPQILKLLESGSKTERGIAADIIEQISMTKPELLKPHIKVLVGYINDRVPKVKWGIPEAIGNLAQKYPDETVEAVPKLLINAKDDSTVVKWCAAFALGEIAKNNLSIQDSLVLKITEIANAERNNGVRNVYLKAIKKIKK